MFTCDCCAVMACDDGNLENAPKNCPCRMPERMDPVREHYRKEENRHLAYHSARVEAEGYCQLTRLEETMDFARRCGFAKLGIAFCIGLKTEAGLLGTVLRENGFEVDSVACKCGYILKEFIGIQDHEKVEPGTPEPMCNPIGQAELLNQSETELNIVLGLCVGHDSLFFKHSAAPVTVLAAKDRVLAHNPMGALYLSKGYYKKKLHK